MYYNMTLMAHIHEKIDWCVDVFIVHEDKVLLRMHEKYHTLLSVGGHVELDEDPMTAAKRECLEEVGLPIHIFGEADTPVSSEGYLRHLVTPAGMNIHDISETHQHISIVYFATTEHTNIVPEHPDDTWEWLTRNELTGRDDIRDNIKHYALGALNALST
ncbi:MAG: 8-oxo-dGTP pyrophosphatase MutT (NUDIX family) [Candidatus Azotimanducaceae bacterium]|jgi:8-oxo-dGTP pyrophosphatase MutT (NUDIX family)